MKDQNRLVVIIGAGSSYDCVDGTKGVAGWLEEWRPPLTYQIFESRGTFNPVLHKYPKAEGAASQFRARVKQDTALLERELRKLRDSTNPGFRQEYYQIACYLQELFGEVSNHFILPGSTTSFTTLVRDLARSRFEHVSFLTLNYDLFLDKALQVFYSHKFDSTDAYVPQDNTWRLVKLHGSVNWGWEVLNFDQKTGDSVATIAALEDIKLATDIRFLSGYQEGDRWIADKFYFPAMILPVEGKSGFVCPEAHVAEMRSALEKCTHYLFIGFSALDDDFREELKLVSEVERAIIVNGGKENAAAALDRITEKNDKFLKPTAMQKDDVLYSHGFSTFVESNEFSRFLGDA